MPSQQANDDFPGFQGDPTPQQQAATRLATPEDRAPSGMSGLAPGSAFGRYTVVKLLGKGGMGMVYLAEDPELRRQVALKILPFAAEAESMEAKRFLREARSAGRLRHPHIVPIHEAGQIGDRFYFTMDVIRGQELGNLAGKLNRFEKLKILYRVCQAVGYAHSQGIIHRDLKPSNIMVDVRHHPFVMDFGLAKDTESQSMLSYSGQVLGTPAYMSPEQAKGQGSKLDNRSDIWSLGAILYYLLSGRPAFQGATIYDTMFAVIHSEPPDLSKLPDMPTELSAIVRRCLAKGPDDRYQKAEDLAKDLLAFLKHDQVAAKRGDFARRVKARLWDNQRVRLGILIGAPSLIVLIVGLTLLLRRTPMEEILIKELDAGGEHATQAWRSLGTMAQEGRIAAKWKETITTRALTDIASEDPTRAQAATDFALRQAPQFAIPILIQVGLDPARSEPNRLALLGQARKLMTGNETSLANTTLLKDLSALAAEAKASVALREAALRLLPFIPEREARQEALFAIAQNTSQDPRLRREALKLAGADVRAHEPLAHRIVRLAADEDEGIRTIAERILDDMRPRESILTFFGSGERANAALAGAAKVVAATARTEKLAMDIIADAEGDAPRKKPAAVNPDAPSSVQPEVLALAALAADLRGTDQGKRLQAANDLGRLDDPKALAPLCSALKEPDAELRRMASSAILRLSRRHPVPLERILPNLANPQAGIRASVAEILGMLEAKAAVSDLVKALEAEQDALPTRRLIRALGMIGDPIALPALTKVWEARRQDFALELIEAWRCKKGFQGAAKVLLIEASKDPRPSVREAATAALTDL